MHLEDLTIEEAKRQFFNFILPYEDEYPDQMLQEFCNYWTEEVIYHNKVVLRFQKQPKFFFNLRLARWAQQGQPGKTKALRQFVQKDRANYLATR